MVDAQRYFTEPLMELRGLYIPESEIDLPYAPVADRLDSGPEAYETAADPQHWSSLLDVVFGEVERPLGAGLQILSIGTRGGTSTVLPCLSLFPQSTVIVTDASPQLLRRTHRQIVDAGFECRAACVCTDPTRNPYREAVFDLAVGGSILNQLVSPDKALSAVYHALKPGSLAIFFEPFEGYAVLRVAAELFLARAEHDWSGQPEGLRKFLEAVVLDLQTRSGTDKSAAYFEYMASKWLFTRSYFERINRDIGFQSIHTVPIHAPARQYREGLTTLLRSASFAEDTVPDWGWEYVDAVDHAFSDELKRDVPLDAAVVLRR